MKKIENIRLVTKKCFEDLNCFLNFDTDTPEPSFGYPKM